MPKYAKFIKEVLSKKRWFTEYETVTVTKNFTDVIKQIPPKQKNSGSFSIPCHIGNKFLGISYPRRIIEDVLVKVDKFIFPANFIILDFEADKEMPLLLGRPFLATTRTLIDVKKGKLTLRVNDEHVTFNMHHLIKAPSHHEQCSCIDIIDQIVQEDFNKSMFEDPLEAMLWGFEIDDVEEVLALMNASSSYSKGRAQFETLDLSSLERQALKPSLEEPLILELKTLPTHL
ncbi:uncharacterized protein LOC114732914 [Neltuma alba]|uniref:uncharacterized protein LOC114732914 n=1 Tax=Neltuma alba TaxID=207710 RepID=UPI0010A3BA18|nr:uncharacterized protein LOC114732914 [Prosopis alba]